MSRRVVGVTLVGTSVLLGMPASHGDTPPPPQLPMATCDAHVKDGPNDGIPNLSVVQVNPLPPVKDPRGNVPGLDIASITFRVTDTKVYAFMSVADIPDALRDTDSAYGYAMWFRRGGKFARFDNVYANPTLAAQGLAPKSGYPSVSVGTTSNGSVPITGVGGGIDKAKNIAYVSVDRAALEAQLGGAIEDGEEFDSISGRTELWETDGTSSPGAERRPADTAEDLTPDKAVWDVGDDGCFAASHVVTATLPTLEYGDRATVAAPLTDDAGKPLPGRKVTLNLPGESAPRTVTTDADGVLHFAIDAPVAGTYALRISYAGDDVSGPATSTSTVIVRAETIRIAKLAVKASGTSRTVTATLTEDDPKAFANQPVAWYVNGKKVATVTTDAAGRSVFKGAKPGQKVQARYAGVAGRYLAVVSNIATV